MKQTTRAPYLFGAATNIYMIASPNAFRSLRVHA